MKYLPFFALGLCPLAVAGARAAEPFALREGDRVVLLGSTLIEREQRYGYWETALTRRFPSVTFRNLGWSGDTVFGDARAGFGTQADGFRHLKEHVLALKPTVLIIGYGTNESFDGPKGLPRFVKGLETLLDTFAPTKARVVLLSPIKQENLGPPLPDPKDQNKNLGLYTDVIREVAKKRGHLFIDLYDVTGNDLLGESADAIRFVPLTDNGIHLTTWGYWLSAPVFERRLGLLDALWFIDIREGGRIKMSSAIGARTERIREAPLCFRVTDTMLPMPSQPEEGAPGGKPLIPKAGFAWAEERATWKGRPIRVGGLVSGAYTLTIDGKKIVSATAKEWFAGLFLNRGPEFEQAERLRQAIVAKNRLYFYRWRPENETYLFGFRKHEQGQNAREIPQFDPLIAEKEKEIAKLRVPVPHTYELKAEKKP